MNNDLIEIIMIIDKSGSMSGKESDVDGGFASFLEDQRKQPGQGFITLVEFADYPVIKIDRAPLNHDMKYKLKPAGCTALFDAIGSTLDRAGKRLANLPEPERPGKVMVIIMTDGMENASRDYNAETIRTMISHQRDKYSWEFLFMGANMDAFLIGQQFGMLYGQTVNCSRNKVGATFASASLATNKLRGTVGQSVDIQAEYDKMEND